jgi:hypothetical protein
MIVRRASLLFVLAGLAIAIPTVRVLAQSAAPMGGSTTQPQAPARAEAVQGESLPVRRITLYRSGVGAFERQGTIADRATVTLQFDASQLNDILKSLQLLDLDGGRIDSVSYASKDPLEKRLAAFGVPIGDSPSLSGLLARLRGAEIALALQGSTVTGKILSVETRKVPGGKDAQPIDESFLNLVTPTGIRSIPTSSVSTFELKDKQLNEELAKALTALAESRTERVKSLDLTLNGEGSRRVVVRYVHETPVWKTSYRLLLPETPAEAKPGEGKPAPGGTAPALTLQGWAIVENTTDSDWRDVRLSLVSGRPVSFRMDLAEPLYVFRPAVPVPTVPGVMPREFEGGMGVSNLAALAPAPALSTGAPGAPPMRADARSMGGIAAKAGRPRGTGGPGGDEAGYAGELKEMAATAEDLLRYSPAVQAKVGQTGEVFFFEVTNPITIGRQRSAMIPFLTSPIEGRRVSVFNLADGREHPLRGVEITNSSKLQFLPGPLSVYDGAAYAGDAQIGHVPAGDKRLLAYAVDLEVAVNTRAETDSNVVKLRIVDGLFEQTNKAVNKMTYTFKNKDAARARTMVVEHEKLDGYDLKQPAKPAEQTQALYRFELPVSAGQTSDLVVEQERVMSQRLGITSYDLPTVVQFQKQGKASAAVVKAITDLAARQSAVNEAERRLADQDKALEKNAAEQLRVSQTMSQLPQNSDVYADYLKDLRELNNTLKTLRADRPKLAEQLDNQRRELNDFIRNLKAE